MIKHRLMLSAAAAAISAALAAAMAATPARADTTITTSTAAALSTSTSGNITIDQSGGIGISQAATAAVTINSNNFVINNGVIANTGVDDAAGVLIDTSSGNLFPGATGLTSTGTIDLGGKGTNKRGVMIQGGKTFYGPITLTNLNAVSLTGAVGVTGSSSMIVQGDGSAAILLVQGTKITSNLVLGGGGILQNASTGSTNSNSIMVDLDGTVNGNVYLAAGLSGVGPGTVALQTLGGIHSCASDTAAPAGFTCPTSSSGALINASTISLIGTVTPSSRGNNPQSGSAIIIGGSVDGGFLNFGPGTSSNVGSTAQISSAGLVLQGVTQATILIDPSRSAVNGQTAPRGPVVLGPIAADVDAIDPGYSFINRGTIAAQPQDPDLSTAAVLIQGSSPSFFACLGTSVSATACDTTPHAVTQAVTSTVNGANTTTTANYTAGGGLLNTGSIVAIGNTNSQTVTAAGITTATALYIGPYATVPRLDVKSEAITGSTNTPGAISAQVSGIGQGSAFGVILGVNSNLPIITIGKGAKITAQVDTATVSPTKSIANSASPFSLVSTAILDLGGSLKTVNNAGIIQAVNTNLTPDTGAVVSSITTAINMVASTTGGINVNNSGTILGHIFFGTAGNGNTLNVGNTGTGGTTANAATGLVNSSSSYAIVAKDLLVQTAGLAPITTAGVIDFGSGNGHTLHVGGYGYVNAVINSAAAGLAVQVDANGQLFVANTSTSVQASTFNIGANGTLGLAISQTNLNSLTPVVQATSANLSGANLALQFGTYISSGFTAASAASPSIQTITLLRSPTITDTTLAAQNAQLAMNTPFLFETPAEMAAGGNNTQPLSIGSDGAQQTLLLKLLPRSTGAKNPDGSAGLNLSGQAQQQFPFTTAALSTDNELGAAVATSLTVYNTPGTPSSGINILASQQQAQRVFSQFSPDVSGGTREIAIMLTDQATGPVAARQRLLRAYGKVAGDTTLWGEEFTGQINNKGRTAADGTITAYKDHGFGFTLGVDAGSPRNGWYGGAFTFYTGDVTQDLPRATRTNTQWYMLTGYSHWQGRRVFADTQLSAAYGDFDEIRRLNVGNVLRTSTSRRPGAMLSMGGKMGTILKYAGFEVDPHVSLDGLTLREEGYTEANGGPGMNLDVAPYFANSLRGAVGADFKRSIALWGFDLTPEARLGYRYDVLQQPVKVRAAFQSTGGRGTAGNTVTFVGPDPDSGNAIVGLSLGASTDTWQVGVNYDWVRGNNGSTTQVGILTVLGRI